jgi:hypothetical protein
MLTDIKLKVFKNLATIPLCGGGKDGKPNVAGIFYGSTKAYKPHDLQ